MGSGRAPSWLRWWPAAPFSSSSASGPRCVARWRWRSEVIPAVILAAGRGSRLRRAHPHDPELTAEQAAAAQVGAKGAVPLLGRSILERQLEILRRVGVREVCVVVRPGNDPVQAHLARAALPGLELRFAIQPQPDGSAGAVLAAESVVGDRPFLVLNGDNLYPEASLRRLVEADGDVLMAFRARALAREGGIDPDRIAAFALVEVSGDGSLNALHEKPSPEEVARHGPDPLVSMNCWRFTPGIFRACARVAPSIRGERELPAAVLARQRETGIGVRVLVSEEGVLDLTCRADIPRLEARLERRARKRWEESAGESGPAFSLFVPGRIELVGKHTDYAGGRSLVMATEQGISVRGWVRRTDGPGRLVVHDGDRGRRASFPLASLGPEPAEDLPVDWERYPAGVVRRLVQDVPGLAGRPVAVELELTSTLPRDAGMSSSTALVVAVALGLLRGVLGPPPWSGPWSIEQGGDRWGGADRLRLAEYLAVVEAGGAGTEGGSQDHAAILLGQAGSALQLSYRPLQVEEEIPFPDAWLVAVAISGVRAPKAGRVRDRYNDLSRQTELAAARWREVTGGGEPHLGALLLTESGPGIRAVEARLTAAGVEPSLIRRLRHFHGECARIVPQASRALGILAAAGDGRGEPFPPPSSFPSHGSSPSRALALLARAAHRSQRMAEEVLGNQVPETRYLVRSARRLGAPAASAFGAGFGGAVWALVPREGARDFVERWAADYGARYPEHRGGDPFLLTGAGGFAGIGGCE
ncbi:MAG: hypothetical protein EA422_11565 [Gemmatimonadales bacterium]|nr:MAG: hypothetical protein EA422_11565 [Gemmatimonadales bacterium]